MDYIKTEWKKLGSISLIIVGVFLIVEHIYTYGGIEFLDILGHEWFGILFIVAGLLWANKWGSMKFKEAWVLVKDKLSYVFKKRKV